MTIMGLIIRVAILYYSRTSPLGHLSKGGTLLMGTLFLRPVYIIYLYLNLSIRGTLLMGTKSSSPAGVPISEVPLYFLVHGDLSEIGSEDVVKLLRPSVSPCVFRSISNGGENSWFYN